MQNLWSPTMSAAAAAVKTTHSTDAAWDVTQLCTCSACVGISTVR